VAEAVDDLIRWSVVEALPPSPSLRQAKEALSRRSDSRCLICDLESPHRPASLVQDSNFVEKYSAKYLVTGLKMWAVGEEALGEHNPASEMHVQVNVSFRLPSVAAAVPAATNLDRKRHACHYSTAPYEHRSAIPYPD